MRSCTPKCSAVRNGEATAASSARSRSSSRRRIVRRLQLGAERRLDAALHRQRAPVARRPGPAAVRPVPVDDAGAAHAVDAAQDQLGLRHACLVDRGDGAGAVPERAAPLGDRPDRHPGLVGEADDRQVEGLAEVDEPGDRLRALRRHGRALERIGRDHADRVAGQPGQGGDRRAAVLGVAEHRARVEDRLEDGADPVRPARIRAARRRAGTPPAGRRGRRCRSPGECRTRCRAGRRGTRGRRRTPRPRSRRSARPPRCAGARRHRPAPPWSGPRRCRRAPPAVRRRTAGRGPRPAPPGAT